MAYVPEDARWYLADVVLEFTVEGDPRNVVHVNLHLIEATSPEQAHEKATALGRKSEQVYGNTEGRTVRVRFRGLRDLNVIHDALEDGAELTYEESADVAENKLAEWVRPKDELTVFADLDQRPDPPNYMPEFVLKLLKDAEASPDEGKSRHWFVITAASSSL